MKKIFSGIEKEKLLHIIYKKEDIFGSRFDICEGSQLLQVAALKLENGKTFQPHKHIPCHKTHNITQESWVVITGKVEAIHYDLDDTIIERTILNAGDVSITFLGGHNYKSLSDETIVYEFKTGPYFGQEKDKTFI